MQRFIRLSALAVAAVALAACGRKEADEPVATTTAAGTTVSPSTTAAAINGTSLVRFVNALPTPKGVDLMVNDKAVFQGIATKAVTPYAEVATNSPRFTLRGTGKDSMMAENKEVIVDGRRYTAVALPKADGTSELRLWRDELVPADGKARIRVIHAAPGIDDVRIGVAGSDQPLFTGVSYGSEAGFKDVTPNDLMLVIRRNVAGAEPIKLKAIRLVAGRAYTLVLVTRKGVLQVITFEDQGQGTASR